MFGIGVPEFIIILVIWVLPGTIGAILAKNKGRSGFLWFVICALFWLPIFIVMFLPPVKEVPGKFRECPSCREFVKWNAIICKHCKTELSLTHSG
jgi:hypothetical protein